MSLKKIFRKLKCYLLCCCKSKCSYNEDNSLDIRNSKYSNQI